MLANFHKAKREKKPDELIRNETGRGKTKFQKKKGRGEAPSDNEGRLGYGCRAFGGKTFFIPISAAVKKGKNP